MVDHSPSWSVVAAPTQVQRNQRERYSTASAGESFPFPLENLPHQDLVKAGRFCDSGFPQLTEEVRGNPSDVSTIMIRSCAFVIVPVTVALGATQDAIQVRTFSSRRGSLAEGHSFGGETAVYQPRILDRRPTTVQYPIAVTCTTLKKVDGFVWRKFSRCEHDLEHVPGSTSDSGPKI